MLSDRYYMRRPTYPFWSVTTGLIMANAAIFFIQLFVERFTQFDTDHYLALSLAGLKQGYIWQLLTFQFLHANFLHLFFNCLGIYVFGRELEEALGRKSYLTLYLCSGIFGGLLQVGAGALVPVPPHSAWAAQFLGHTVGASAGVFGLIAAFAMLAPNREFAIYLFFVLPVTIRAWWLLAGSAALALIGLAFPTNNVASAAHIGGMIAGVFFIRYAINWEWPELRRKPAPLARQKVKVHPGSSALWDHSEGGAEDEEMPAAEFLSREVDPILDKISAHGIQSLTAHERKILEAARQKMGKR